MNVNSIILEAIALKKCVEATYNRARIKLAPHILYSRSERMFIDAMTIEREGQPPREAKIGTFQIDGLRDLTLIDRNFSREPMFDPQAVKYAGVTLFAID